MQVCSRALKRTVRQRGGRECCALRMRVRGFVGLVRAYLMSLGVRQ
uniref:Uncharacterized protein n=1 Tax=Arundo donax TaxID=35708 RepID=A0A0A8YA51_ARUDO